MSVAALASKFFYRTATTTKVFKSSAESIFMVQRSFHGSFLPLVFGLPFAPELDTGYSSFSSQEATLSQELITFTVNFATTGYVFTHILLKIHLRSLNITYCV